MFEPLKPFLLFLLFKPMNPNKVLLGMSGGVDSSVSAVLLLEAGYEVIGAFMKNWSSCDWREDRRDAMRVAAKLGIEFITLDFEKEYREKVVENLFEEYAAGRTPNPDVLCNKYVKFDLFVKAADKLGCDHVATGHYANLASPPNLGGELKGRYKKTSLYSSYTPPSRKRDTSPRLGEEGEVYLARAHDDNKDQTYFLWAMPREVLSRVLFPLGDLAKPEVREIARKHELPVSEKKDSVGICFVGEVDIQEFLKERIPENPGEIKTTDGRVVGEHNGLAYYTIGQRHGIGVRGGEPPYYVVRKDLESNTLVVGTEVDPALFSDELVASQLNWLVDMNCHSVTDGYLSLSDSSISCLVRIRYRQPLQKAHVKIEGEKIKVTFKESQRAVTPGQSIVMYSKDGVVIGGGVIE